MCKGMIRTAPHACGSRPVPDPLFLEPCVPRTIFECGEPAVTVVCAVVEDDMKTGQTRCVRRRTPGFRAGLLRVGRRSGERPDRVKTALTGRTDREKFSSGLCQKQPVFDGHDFISLAAESLSLRRAPTVLVGARPFSSASALGTPLPPVTFHSPPPRFPAGVFLHPEVDLCVIN